MSEVREVPLFFQKLGLEWFYRLISEPKRIRRQLVLPRFVEWGTLPICKPVWTESECDYSLEYGINDLVWPLVTPRVTFLLDCRRYGLANVSGIRQTLMLNLRI